MSKQDLVKRRVRDGKSVLVIDFFYQNEKGKQRRFRRDAAVQRVGAARAEAARLIELAAVTGSPFGKPSSSEVTFGVFVDDVYRPEFMPLLRPGTRVRYEGILRQGVLDYFRTKSLDAIDGSIVLTYAAYLKERPRRRRLRGKRRGIDPRAHVNFVRSVLQAAVTKASRAQAVRTHPGASSSSVATCSTSGASGSFSLSANRGSSGLRQGEARAVQVADVDFAANVLRVRRTFSEDEMVPPKGKRERVVPMAPELAAILREAVRDKLPRAFVVTDETGRPPSRQKMLHRLKAFERQRGLREWWCHALRHYFCTRLTNVGASIEAVRELAGHANLRTTQRYVHATGGELHAAIAKLTGN